MQSGSIELEGCVDRITFHAKETGYTVFRLKTSQETVPPTFTVVGLFPTATVGLQIKVWGQWTSHPKYGKQFKADRILEVTPHTPEGIVSFLSSGLFKGVGPKTASVIVETFGLDALTVLEKEPDKLSLIKGFSRKKIESIQSSWKRYQSIRDVMVFLQGYGISTAYAFRIYRTYGDACVQILKQNPYQLAEDVAGIGFKQADRIAQNMGIHSGHPERIRQGILYVLLKGAEQGNTYLPKTLLADSCSALLEQDLACVETQLSHLLQMGQVCPVHPSLDLPDPSGIASKPCFEAEQSLYRLIRLRGVSHPSPEAQWANVCESWLKGYTRIQLSDEQTHAIRVLSQSSMGILTGGPGCGKTTTLHALVQLYQSQAKKVLCCAPTGRAARRMSEVIQVPAKTIHRLLEFDPKQGMFLRDETFPLQGDCLIVDESSMVDVQLALALLRAVPPNMQIIWVGDKDQLPSVGAGRFLGDLIDLNLCPTVFLTQIFRQASRSLIVVNAHRVNSGEFPYLTTVDKGRDFIFESCSTPEDIQTKILEWVTVLLPNTYGYGLPDIKVLTPMHKGVIGTTQLNVLLQKRLNPKAGKGPGLKGSHEKTFFEGDSVIQLVNNYHLNLMNGEIGRVESIDPEQQTAVLKFDNRSVDYDLGDLQELDLGYAMSIHKSQGSEFPVVVLPLHESHFVMLSRKLFYTALTRAKKLCVIIGSKRAVAMSVKNAGTEDRRRYSLLPYFHEQERNGVS
jgi:exodeoxyribonuclease V alpha subunit